MTRTQSSENGSFNADNSERSVLDHLESRFPSECMLLEILQVYIQALIYILFIHMNSTHLETKTYPENASWYLFFKYILFRIKDLFLEF